MLVNWNLKSTQLILIVSETAIILVCVWLRVNNQRNLRQDLNMLNIIFLCPGMEDPRIHNRMQKYVVSWVKRCRAFVQVNGLKWPNKNVVFSSNLTSSSVLYARFIYWPVLESTRISSPTFTKDGTVTTAPVSRVAGFVPPTKVQQEHYFNFHNSIRK